MRVAKPPNSPIPYDAGEAGKLGVVGLKRFWAQKIASRAGGKGQQSEAGDPRFDGVLLAGLRLGLRETLDFLITGLPAFEEFEAWVLMKNGGAIEPARVQRLNMALQGGGTFALESVMAEPVLSAADLEFWDEHGYIVVKRAVSVEESRAAVQAILSYAGMSLEQPDSWYNGGLWIPLAHHPALWANRNSRRIHTAFSQIWRRSDLWINVDVCGVNPPVRPGYSFAGTPLHWDMTLAPPLRFGTQAILYLTDTAANQGAFSCVPGFHRRLESWLKEMPAGADPRSLAARELRATPIAGEAGDLIIWHQALPHAATAPSAPATYTANLVTQYALTTSVNPSGSGDRHSRRLVSFRRHGERNRNARCGVYIRKLSGRRKFSGFQSRERGNERAQDGGGEFHVHSIGPATNHHLAGHRIATERRRTGVHVALYYFPAAGAELPDLGGFAPGIGRQPVCVLRLVRWRRSDAHGNDGINAWGDYGKLYSSPNHGRFHPDCGAGVADRCSHWHGGVLYFGEHRRRIQRYSRPERLRVACGRDGELCPFQRQRCGAVKPDDHHDFRYAVGNVSDYRLRSERIEEPHGHGVFVGRDGVSRDNNQSRTGVHLDHQFTNILVEPGCWGIAIPTRHRFDTRRFGLLFGDPGLRRQRILPGRLVQVSRGVCNETTGGWSATESLREVAFPGFRRMAILRLSISDRHRSIRRNAEHHLACLFAAEHL